MKKLLLFILLSGLYESVVAQESLLRRPYRPKETKASIARFLKNINQQTGIVLEYSSGSFDSAKVIQLTGTEATVGDVLKRVLDGQAIKLLEHNRKIILVPSADDVHLAGVHQPRYRIYGYITEKATGEPLVRATVYEPASGLGVFSNNEGYFNFHLQAGKHTIRISYAGLRPVTLDIDLQDHLRKDIPLSFKSQPLSQVTITPDATKNDGSIKMRTNETSATINTSDPLQYLYLFPGLQNVSYSFSSYQVRGGGTDENLLLLNGNRVYNPTHLLGAISIINPTVLKSMHFYKSDFPARLGGSLSSILEILTKQGNMNNWKGEGNVGLLAGSLTLEGPIVKDKIAVMISGRKHIPFRFVQSLQDGIKSDFYDAHLRVSAIVNPRNKLAINLYKGEDNLRQTGKYIDNLHQWGNTIGSLRWNTMLGSQSFIKTSLSYSQYKNLGAFKYTLFEKDDGDDNEDNETEEQEVDSRYIGTYSSIKTYSIKSAAEIYISGKWKLNTGLKLSKTSIKPFDSKITSLLEEDEDELITSDPLQFDKLSGYGEVEVKVGKQLFVKPGIRLSGYQQDSYHTLVLQPRLYIAYRFGPSQKLYASYSRMNQFLHLVTNPYAGANRDLWVPSTEYITPEKSNIYNVGYSFQQGETWQFSIESYYKGLMNVTNYAEGKSTFINDEDWEQHIELGKGRSYGTEVLIKKTGAKWSGQAAYALSWSWRQFSSINNGRAFPYKYDHRHSINVGLTYSISSRIDISALWSFATGNVYTHGGVVLADSMRQIPAGEDPFDDFNFKYSYSPDEQYRAKSYQRYDMSLIYHTLKGKTLQSVLKAGIYNINGASEQYSYSLRGSLHTKSIRIKTGSSVFHLMPYLSYTLKF